MAARWQLADYFTNTIMGWSKLFFNPVPVVTCNLWKKTATVHSTHTHIAGDLQDFDGQFN